MFHGHIYKHKKLPRKDRWIVINRDQFACYECGEALIINMKYFPQISIVAGVFHHVLQQIFDGANDHTNSLRIWSVIPLTRGPGPKTFKEKSACLFK